MTSQSPRIYLYKITFEEVPYYYYGVHKEKYFNQEYWGSPVTHKWCWKLYTPKKQILQFFKFTDEGWLKAQEVESRIIKPIYQTDKWCLNENCGGKISISSSIKAGLKNKENGTGFFSMTKEEKLEVAKKVGHSSFINKTGVFSVDPERRKNLSKIQGKKLKEQGLGIFSMTDKERHLLGVKNGERNKELKLGICGLSKEERKEIGKKYGYKGGRKAKELGLGIHSQTFEERSEAGKKGGKISGTNHKLNGTGCFKLTKEERIEVIKKTNSQKWMCTETGYITTSGPLTMYQRARGIDTSKRVRIL
jgi:general stress protein YciG